MSRANNNANLQINANLRIANKFIEIYSLRSKFIETCLASARRN